MLAGFRSSGRCPAHSYCYFRNGPCADSTTGLAFDSRVRLLAGNGHAFDAKRGARDRAAELQVIADLSDVVQNVLQIAGDGDFLYRIGQLAVFNPQSARALREVAGDQVHAVTHQLSHEETLFDSADDLLWCLYSRFQKKFPVTDRRS